VIRAEDLGAPAYPKGEDAARILIVDDRPTSRAIVRGVLARPGYRLTEAASASEALAALAAEPYDLVLLDLVLPDRNGLDLLARLRAEHSASELPVIIATVTHERSELVRALELGANDYLTKPLDFAILRARVEAQLSRKRAEDAVRESHALLESRVEERTAELRHANRTLAAEIAERKRAEAAWRASEERYRSLFEQAPIGIREEDWSGLKPLVDELGEAANVGRTLRDRPALLEALADKVVLRACNAATLATYRAADRGAFAALGGHVHAADGYLAFGDALAAFARGEQRSVLEAWQAACDGRRIFVRDTLFVPEEFRASWGRVVHVTEDLTEAHTLSERLSWQARHDGLTGLANRQAFEHRLEAAIAALAKEPGEHALLYLDLDQFKLINDTCGHVAGDALLRQLAPVLAEQVGERDTLARLGGDEFGVLLERAAPGRAQRLAEDLRTAIEGFHFTWEDKRFAVGVSIGVVPIRSAEASLASVLSAADRACYVAKDAGRNRIHVYREDDVELARRHGEMQWVGRLTRALEEGRLELWSQTIAPLAGPGKGLRCELLLRMRDEHGRVVLPAAFLPAAERYGLAVRLDRWVVERALAWLPARARRRDGLALCSINLSGRSLGDGDFRRFVLGALDAARVPAGRVCFEITETAAIANLAEAARFVAALRERGCRVALDDFGSGLSSFAYLKNLPVDFLKIDGAFVKDVVEDSIDLAMVRSINDIAHEMGKQTIAEFVESEAILEKLRGIGVDYAQGYAVCRPQPL